MGKNGDKDSRPKKKTRGPSTGKTFEEILSNQENAEDQWKNEKNEKKEKLYIDFNELGQPYGRWLKKFRSDMGNLARNIRIIKSWKDVTNGEKTTMWRCAKKTWNLEDDKKKFILRVVRNRFKDWKTRMTSTYIFPKQKTDDGEEKSDDGEEKSDDGEEKSDDGEVAIKSPVGKYKQLTQEDWDEFVKQRMTADFQEKRKKAQNAQKQNVHPHYLGRAGYVGKQDKWYVEELTKEAENQPNKDPALTQKTVVERLSDRGYAWIKAHTPPTTAEPPTKLQKVINEYGIWKEKEEKGEFVPSRFEDALVKALGKPEHTGRTRGVGGCVGEE
ncbi:uncharacterized protein LOC141629086 [Silene latifolia]|uniref:uncharacterized protein LOC141629086 n=1 Tax=Silene latifolia TaxID=37657 RepID=UPI003D76DF64